MTILKSDGGIRVNYYPESVILNVNDNRASSKILNRILSSAGYEVIEAYDGLEALQLVKKMPDLVILDVKLPDIDGFEVCQRIKSDPLTSSIPVLHLSATYRDDKSRIAGFESGADAYLTFPVEPTVLVSSVRALLQLREAERKELAIARQWTITFNAIGDSISLLDENGKILRCNQATEKLLGRPGDEILGNTCQQLFREYLSDPGIQECPFERMKKSGKREQVVFAVNERWLDIVVDPIMDENGRFEGAVQIVSDITERKNAEKEREKLVHELQEALAQVKTLKGFLPICASCKKIRDDEGYWHRVEEYIRDHAGVEFTHGMCPECARKLYADYMDDE